MGLKDRYKQELERLGPGQEELERLYTLIEGGTDMKWKKWLGRRAVAAIAVCAALTLTATAAAVPAVWQSLQEHLGPFAPYAQTIKGASAPTRGSKSKYSARCPTIWRPGSTCPSRTWRGTGSTSFWS